MAALKSETESRTVCQGFHPVLFQGTKLGTHSHIPKRYLDLLVPDLKYFPAATNMSSTSQKHRNFVAEPMGDKPVTELAGVGEVLGKRLETAGFDKAFVVLGQFLVLKKNKELFQEWMKETCSANSKQSSDCYQCLNDWCDEFLY